MTDHIGETTKKVIDLDALEKLADEATPWRSWSSNTYSEWVEFLDTYDYAPGTTIALLRAAPPATIKALIAELKEAKGLLRQMTPCDVGLRNLYLTEREGIANFGDAACVSISTTLASVKAARAFLARNGKGEG